MNRGKKPERPGEKDAVFTTIVGGRPPGSGTQVGSIPHGIEVLVKKASVDPKFRRLLLEKRAEAAREIDLDLTQAEVELLANIPRKQLEKIIANTKVPPEQKDLFSSTFGKVMLATVAAGVAVAIFTPSLGHTLTPKQRERFLRMREAALKDINNVNEPNEAESATEKNEQP